MFRACTMQISSVDYGTQTSLWKSINICVLCFQACTWTDLLYIFNASLGLTCTCADHLSVHPIIFNREIRRSTYRKMKYSLVCSLQAWCNVNGGGELQMEVEASAAGPSWLLEVEMVMDAVGTVLVMAGGGTRSSDPISILLGSVVRGSVRVCISLSPGELRPPPFYMWRCGTRDRNQLVLGAPIRHVRERRLCLPYSSRVVKPEINPNKIMVFHHFA
jgi:hypothetical protein